MQIALTRRSLLRSLISWGLAAFFLISAIANIAPPASLSGLARWGYADWVHPAMGVLDLIAALLLAQQRTRRSGALLAAPIMGTMLAMMLIHGDIDQATAPAIVLAALGLCLYLDVKALEARWEGKPF